MFVVSNALPKLEWLKTNNNEEITFVYSWNAAELTILQIGMESTLMAVLNTQLLM